MKFKGILRTVAIFLFAVFIVAFIGMVLYIAVPNAKAGMDYYLGPTGQNIMASISGAWMGFIASDTYLIYIVPNIPWIFLGFGILLTIFILNPVKDSITGWFATRHKVSLPTTSGQVGMLASSDIRATTPAGATTRPTVIESPSIVEPKKEET